MLTVTESLERGRNRLRKLAGGRESWPARAIGQLSFTKQSSEGANYQEPLTPDDTACTKDII